MRDTSPLYGPLLHLGGRASGVFETLSREPLELDEIRSLLGQGWRDDLVAAVSCLFRPERDECRSLLWRGFDTGSWVAPQLAICAMVLDPGGFEEVRRRLLTRCATRTDHLQNTDPMWRHVVHGTAEVATHNLKGMAALIGAYAHVDPAWMATHIPLEDAFWALETDMWDHGEAIACSWIRALALLLPEGPGWLRTPPANPERLLDLWNWREQPAAVRRFCQGNWEQRIRGLCRGLLEKGVTACTLEEGRLTTRTVQGAQVLLELPGPYLVPGLWNRLTVYSGENRYHLEGDEPPAALDLRPGPQGLEITLVTERPDTTRLRILDARLEDCQANVLVLGIDAEARLDGGAAQAVSLAAGPEHREQLQELLADHRRLPGSAVITSAFALRERRVFELAHVITRPAPTVAELVRAVTVILDCYRAENYGTLALPALGCGAGGLQARDVALPLLEALQRADHFYSVTLALPRAVDREAFEAAARSMRLSFRRD